MIFNLPFILILVAVLIWAGILMSLMDRKDESFIGKYDKILWFCVVFFGFLPGALIYVFYILTRSLTINSNQAENELRKELNARSTEKVFEFCYHCGEKFGKPTSKCPKCGKVL